ncbi:MAG: arsenate reductase ArsC [Flavobacteriales bacterium]|nr:arsenate reductase ArsC [Flavobacteriales bacterium]
MKKIVFVCIENSNRSQMAQAFACIYGKGKIMAFSAGSSPSGKINPKAIAVMKEVGYDLSTHQSKSITDIPFNTYDYVVTMGCGDNCPNLPAKKRIDWQIPDPRNMNENEFRKVRDLISEKVKELIQVI